MKFVLDKFSVLSIRHIYVKPERRIEGSANIYRKSREDKARRVALAAMPAVPQVSIDFRKKFLDCLYSEKSWWRTLPERVDYSDVVKELSSCKGPNAPPLSWKLIK
ncbi:hypothetical protein DI09_50p100 [Mitosporidium daphniae]|uniref:Uncharacterized protein n=1 Tax=Mitosporidium daphniae TaxID=1485682 RepID=A0A098VPH4_9MICR|nr:uncharacterized protein DI09_50p100 [Mitosporidium daphniae]KGG50903.1 hypothetical protein DI09_50p100 [Mitosporidium daphniae]|eukprot:XP_013237330.1 uncharacterized protein DI09_50p100 [Mitosporidium daphniae]